MHNFTPRLFIVVGSPASGKDELISAVNTIGTLHAEIVPKHTERAIRIDDGDEMICKYILNGNGSKVLNEQCDMDGCDIIYRNYGETYGIKTSEIWDKLRDGIIQVAVVGNVDAINKLKDKFGNLAVVIYVYSQIDKKTFRKRELEKLNKSFENKTGLESSEDDYIKRRVAEFDKAWKIYVDNFMLFDHVLIYAEKQEDLFDQIFRLFKAYEKGLLK